MKKQDEMKRRAREAQWKNAFNINNYNKELREQKKGRMDELDKFEEQETLNHDKLLKGR